jgi:hypothetical protein
VCILTDLQFLPVLHFEAWPEVFVLASWKRNLEILHYYIIEKWACIANFNLVSSQEGEKDDGMALQLLGLGFALRV